MIYLSRRICIFLESLSCFFFPGVPEGKRVVRTDVAGVGAGLRSLQGRRRALAALRPVFGGFINMVQDIVPPRLSHVIERVSDYFGRI